MPCPTMTTTNSPPSATSWIYATQSINSWMHAPSEHSHLKRIPALAATHSRPNRTGHPIILTRTGRRLPRRHPQHRGLPPRLNHRHHIHIRCHTHGLSLSPRYKTDQTGRTRHCQHNPNPPATRHPSLPSSDQQTATHGPNPDRRADDLNQSQVEPPCKSQIRGPHLSWAPHWTLPVQQTLPNPPTQLILACPPRSQPTLSIIARTCRPVPTAA